MIRAILAISCCILLCGCQQVNRAKKSWNTTDKEYLKSTTSAPLKVPAELSLNQDFESYPLPQNLPAPDSLQPVPLEPPGFGKLETRNS
jgi:uncharacterized lipoprotein